MLLFVHHLFGNLIPLTDKTCIFVAENHVYKHCGDVCNDVILMPQFLEVVRQHILGVVLVGNVNIWRNYRHDSVARFFWDTM